VARVANAGLIRYERDSITILDRAGLQAGNCKCYRMIRNEFEQAMA
jgi:hypothetical protein